jgi:two-component system LytT family response regulator
LKLDRGRTSSPGVASTDGLNQLTTLLRRQSARIAIKSEGKFLFVFMADIAAIEAKGNYILLHHTSSSHFLRESISMMEHRFRAYGFVRIHRSALVNAALVEEIRPCSTGEYVLRVRGGREYTVTRTYKQNLHHLAACWLGSDGFYSDRSSVNPEISARGAFNV